MARVEVPQMLFGLLTPTYTVSRHLHVLLRSRPALTGLPKNSLPNTSLRSFASSRMAPSKKIIVCCDGTWQDADNTDKLAGNDRVAVLKKLGPSPWETFIGANTPPNFSTVAKIARSLTHGGKALDDPKRSIPQIIYYQSGVATKEPGLLGQDFDGLTGRGIKENIRTAYGFICNNYEPDDEIYLIGFSRGAYTARCISSLINDVGLMTKHSLGYFYDVFDIWQAKNVIAKHNPGDPILPTFQDVQNKLLFGKPIAFSKKVRINACAVFETVGSLGIPVDDKGPFGLSVNYLGDILRSLGISHMVPGNPKATDAFTFVDTIIAECIDHGIQALALDEHRGHFVPTIWENPNNTAKSLTQTWFSGCHSHIGGGMEDNTDLQNITLAWMMDQLSPFLSFEPDEVNMVQEKDGILREALSLNIKGEEVPQGEYLTDSKTGLFVLDENAIRTPSQYHRTDPKTGKPTSIPLKNTNETIHRSVRERFWNSPHMLASGKLYQPLALKKKWTPGTRHPWPWSWEKKVENIPDIPEAEYTEGENRILALWSNDQTKKELKDFVLKQATA